MGPLHLTVTDDGTESAMLESKLCLGTSKTKRLHPVKLEFSLCLDVLVRSLFSSMVDFVLRDR